MTEIFDFGDYQYAAKQRASYRLVFLVMALVFVALNILIVAFRLQIGRGFARFLNVALSVIIGGAFLFLFKLKFRPVSKYARMLREIKKGLLEKDRGEFLMFDDTVTEKEGVEFYLMIVEERVKKRPDMPERRILIPIAKPKPDVKPGDIISYETQAGILIRYRIVPPKVRAADTVSN